MSGVGGVGGGGIRMKKNAIKNVIVCLIFLDEIKIDQTHVE